MRHHVADLSAAIAELSSVWGDASTVRGNSSTMTALFQGQEGPIQEIFDRLGDRVTISLFTMAPRKTGGEPDMGVVAGRMHDVVSFIARVTPSAIDNKRDVDIRMSMLDEGNDHPGPSEAMFEAIDELLGDLSENGAFLRYMQHLLDRAGRHRSAYYADLADLVATYVREG